MRLWRPVRLSAVWGRELARCAGREKRVAGSAKERDALAAPGEAFGGLKPRTGAMRELGKARCGFREGARCACGARAGPSAVWGRELAQCAGREKRVAITRKSAMRLWRPVRPSAVCGRELAQCASWEKRVAVTRKGAMRLRGAPEQKKHRRRPVACEPQNDHEFS